MNLSEQFLGETDRQNITQGDRFKGETTPSDFTFSGKLESQGLEVPQKWISLQMIRKRDSHHS